MKAQETLKIAASLISGDRAKKHGEIDFGLIRGMIYRLRELGVPIHWITLDSFQSVGMVQRLRQKGFPSGTLSVDKDITPYTFCKNALLDRDEWLCLFMSVSRRIFQSLS